MQNNPFDIPNMGFNQENPLFASMNMMRQMWEGMAQNPMGMSSPTTAIPSAEELDKRIKELRAVENWLRLNLSMLNSTVQGLEIQRSTLSTLQSFAQGGLAAMPGLADVMAQATMQATKAVRPDATTANPTVELSENTESSNEADLGAESLAQAGQAWWNLMQQQFDTLAQATAQSMQQAQSVAENLSTSVSAPSADTTFTKKPVSTKAKATKAAKTPTAAKKTTKTAAKKAAKKTPPTK